MQRAALVVIIIVIIVAGSIAGIYYYTSPKSITTTQGLQSTTTTSSSTTSIQSTSSSSITTSSVQTSTQSTSSSQVAAANTTFVWATSTDPNMWDVYRDNTATSTDVYMLAFNELVRAWPDPTTGSLTYYPDLATSWTASPNGTVWTFNLRQGVHFHDGNLLTANDVAWTFERAITWTNMTFEQSYYLTSMAGITNVTALNSTAVEFKTSGPHGAFLSAISYFMPIYEEKCAARTNFGISTPDCGTGPYELTSYAQGGPYVLSAFHDYWDTQNPPKVSQIKVLYISDPSSREAAFKSGEINGFSNPNPADVASLNASGYSVNFVPNIDLMEYMFNTQQAPFNNAMVRMAANLAIDRAAIIKNILKGLAGPADGEVQLGIFGALNITAQLGHSAFVYNATEASQLLKQSGYSGQPVNMQVMIGYSTADAAVGEAIQGYLQAVGFNVKLSELDVNSMVSEVVNYHTGVLNGSMEAANLPYNLFANPWSSDPDTEITADALFSINGPYGVTFYNNTQMEQLITTADTSTNQTVRQQDYYKVQMILYNQSVYMPLYADGNTVVLDKGITGLQYYHEQINMRGITMSQIATSNTMTSSSAAFGIASVISAMTMCLLSFSLVIPLLQTNLTRRSGLLAASPRFFFFS